MSFGFFFLGEYVSIWTVCCLNVILFWGGYFTFTFISIFIYSLKVIIFVITFIWVRGSLPRYRYDQLMRLGWKILLPISLGFVIFYSGVHLDNLYEQIIEIRRIVNNLESKVSDLSIVGTKFYIDELSYEKFQHDRNWHNFNLWEWDLYGWDWTQFGRSNILRTLNNIYSYEDIWNNWYRLRLISNYYLDIKHDITYIKINPEKYGWILEHVLHIKRKYSLEYILEKRWEYLNELYKEFNEKLNATDLNLLILNLEKDYNDILLSEKEYNNLSLEAKWKALNWELIRNYDYIETQRLNDVLANNFWDYVIADLFKILDSELPKDIEDFWNDTVLRAEIAYVFDLEGLNKEEFIEKMLWYIKAKDLEILDILGDIVEERDDQLYNEWFELEEKKKTLNQILFELIERDGI